MYNCIYILPFLGFKDTPFANFASTSYVFDNVKMLLSKITHLQPALSIPCRCSPVKSRIRNLLFQCFADALHQNFASSISENPLSQISSLNILCCYSLHNLSQYITYKKIDIRNTSEYEMSVGDTQSVNFCVNGFERTCLKLHSSKFEFKFICFQQKFTLLCVTRSWNLSKNSYINFL